MFGERDSGRTGHDRPMRLVIGTDRKAVDD